MQQKWRMRLGVWIESRRIQNFIIGLIIINAVTLGLETSAGAVALAGSWLSSLDRIILAVFVLELGTKLVAFGPRFFRNPWNVFDFIVVGIALVPAAGPLSVLRALRILRVLRLISIVPQLRFVVRSLLQAIPGLTSIAGLMLLLFYVFGVMATGLFGERFPDWFGTLGHSMYTLFQVMTLESWSMGISRPVMEAYPYAWLFFLAFILVTTFTILNLFIGIIVDTMQRMHQSEHEAEAAELEAAVHREGEQIEAAVHREGEQLEAELRALRAEVQSLKEYLMRRSA